MLAYLNRLTPGAPGTLQPVKQGVTRSGQHGLFTHGYLAWQLPVGSPSADHWNSLTHEQRVAYFASLGFDLQGETRDLPNPYLTDLPEEA